MGCTQVFGLVFLQNIQDLEIIKRKIVKLSCFLRHIREVADDCSTYKNMKHFYVIMPFPFFKRW